MNNTHHDVLMLAARAIHKAETIGWGDDSGLADVVVDAGCRILEAYAEGGAIKAADIETVEQYQAGYEYAPTPTSPARPECDACGQRDESVVLRWSRAAYQCNDCFGR